MNLQDDLHLWAQQKVSSLQVMALRVPWMGTVEIDRPLGPVHKRMKLQVSAKPSEFWRLRFPSSNSIELPADTVGDVLLGLKIGFIDRCFATAIPYMKFEFQVSDITADALSASFSLAHEIGSLTANQLVEQGKWTMVRTR